MTASEKYIIGFDNFHPFYFIRPDVRTVEVILVESGSPILTMQITLNSEGRISEFDHVQLGWIGYPPGHKPKLEMDRRTSVTYDADGTIRSNTILIKTGHVMKAVMYQTQEGLLIRETSTTNFDSGILMDRIEKTYQYDQQRKLIGINHFSEQKKRMIAKRTFHRNKHGQIIEQGHEYLMGRNSTISPSNAIKHRYKYDNRVRLIQSLQTDSNQILVTKLFFYEDDLTTDFFRMVTAEKDESKKETLFQYDGIGFLTRQINNHSEKGDELIYRYLPVT